MRLWLCFWLPPGQGRTGRSLLRRVLGGNQEGFLAAPSCVSPRAAGMAKQARGVAAEQGGCVRAPAAHSEGPQLLVQSMGAGRVLQLSDALLPECEQRNPPPWHGRDVIWAWVSHPEGTKRRQKPPMPAAWGERQQPYASWAAPGSRAPPIRDLRKETRLLLMTLL